jgi:hypothetical protein
MAAIRPRVARVHIPSLNHARPPASSLFQTASEAEQAISNHQLNDDLIAAIVGKNATFYIERWRWLSLNRRRWQWCSWNWAAAIFGPAWFGFRRMHWWALVFFVFWQIGILIYAWFTGKDWTAAGNSLTIYTMISFCVTGMIGDAICRRHTESIATNIIGRHLAANDRETVARERGGINWFAAVFWATRQLLQSLPSSTSTLRGRDFWDARPDGLRA